MVHPCRLPHNIFPPSLSVSDVGRGIATTRGTDGSNLRSHVFVVISTTWFLFRRKRTPFLESVHGSALRLPSLRSRLSFVLQCRSGVPQQHTCGLGSLTRSEATAHRRTRRDGRCFRSWCSKTTMATSCSTCAFFPVWMGGCT